MCYNWEYSGLLYECPIRKELTYTAFDYYVKRMR